MTLANAITLLRLVLVPVFIVLFVRDERGWAFAVFCIAGGSDLIDGTVARIMKQSSNWGAILDPIADKLLLESAFICLVIVGVLPLWFFLLALSRDLMIISGITYFKVRRIAFPHRAIWASKFATLAQMATIIVGLIIFWRPTISVASVSLNTLLVAFLGAASALIVVSGFLYVRLGLQLHRR